VRFLSSYRLPAAVLCGFFVPPPAALLAQQVAEIRIIGNGDAAKPSPTEEPDTETNESRTRAITAMDEILKEAGPSGECDKLTEPKELKDPKTTVAREVIDWDHAVVVCQQALDAHPDDPHFHLTMAITLFHTKKYIEANRHYKIAADANIPAAQTSLGFEYYNGFGVVKDDQKAFELWSKAAAAGWPSAMGNLGTAYADGVYVKKDPVKSLDWSEKAIEAGNILSLSVVGNAYLNGNGVPRDFEMAAKYFQQGADLGNGYALKSLANMYEAGFMGAPQPQAAGALRLRAAQLDPDSPDPSSVALYKQILESTRAHPKPQAHRVVRRYVVFHRYRFFGCGLLWC